ncbi:hypothetical protein Tco_0737460 [Tanacetum coccineum]
MEGNDDGQDSNKNKLRFKESTYFTFIYDLIMKHGVNRVFDEYCSTVGEKPLKDNKTTKQKKTTSPLIGRTLKINEMLRKKNAEIEAKRIAEEEEAANDKEEEEEAEDDENVEKNDVELANAAATKSVEEVFAILEGKKKADEQPRKKTNKEAKEKKAKKTSKANAEKEKHVEETEDNVDNMEKDVEDEEAKSADEEANLVEEQASEQADNEEDAEENDDVNQIFNNIQRMPFLNTTKRSNKNQVGKGLTKTVVDESLSEMNKEAKKKKREEQIEKKRKLEPKKKEKQDKDSNQKKSDENEKVNMEESAGEESEVEKHKDDIGIETESEDEEEMKGSIKATRQKVIDILGIPMGNRNLQDLDKRTENDHFIAEWEAQYSHIGKPTPREIALQLSGTTKAGAEPGFQLLYLDSKFFSDLNIIRHRPAIRSWNTQMMRKRIMMETSKGCLGNLEHHGDFDPDKD